MRIRFQPPEQKNSAERALQVMYLLEENLKIMTKDYQKIQKEIFLVKNHHKIDGKFSRQRFLDPDPGPDPVCPERLDPDPVCLERLDPDPVNIRPDPLPKSS